MTSTQLEYAEKRMRQKWYELVMAEQRGTSVQILERMFRAYMLAAEEYNRCSAEYQLEQQEQPLPVPVRKSSVASSPSYARDRRKRKAS